MFEHPDLKQWLPAERLVAGGDSGGFVFDQRVVTKALRDIGPFAFLADGEPFAGCLFHEMVIADGRKMSKHLGNVVDPDELVERYGADTVRARHPLRGGTGEDAQLERRGAALCQPLPAQPLDLLHRTASPPLEDAPHDAEAAADTEFMRDRLRKWCENGLARITDDAEELQMHKAIRDLDPPLRADPGLREARGQAPRPARPRRRRGPGRRPGAAGAGAGALRAPHGGGTAARVGPGGGGRAARWPDSAAIPVAPGAAAPSG